MEILERVGPPHQVGVRVGRRTIVGVGLLAAAALDHAGGAREHVKRRLGQDGGARAGHQHHLQQEGGQGLVVGGRCFQEGQLLTCLDNLEGWSCVLLVW